MYATCASDTSSCRLLLLRGGAEAEGEAVDVDDDDAEAERENMERRRKMRVTELNIVRMVWLDLAGWIWVNKQNKKGLNLLELAFCCLLALGIVD